MPKRVWQPAKPKLPAKPKVADDVRTAVDTQALQVIAALKKRYCKKPKDPRFNWPEDIFTRWHRDAFYFVVCMRTPHEIPMAVETHVARMEHVGGGKFNLAVPMRKGWNTFMSDATVGACLEAITESVRF